MSSYQEPDDQTGAVILAGGKATRLPDKCFRVFDRKELVLHVYERVSMAVPEIVVVGKTVQDVGRLQQILPKARIVHEGVADAEPFGGPTLWTERA